MRVTFVCQWYPPEPAGIPEGIAFALRDAGFDVEVLTGIPNYPTGAVQDGYSATRRSSEMRNGIPVRRSPLYPNHGSSAFHRLLNYGSWAISASIFGQRALRASDVALVYSSPATAALPAMTARAMWGTPYILFIQDLWPDSIFASDFLSGKLRRLAHITTDLFVRLGYYMADHIAVTSPGMIDLLVSRGVPRDKLSLVYNWAPEESFETPDPDAQRSAEAFRRVSSLKSNRLFLYAGNHGYAQGLEHLIRAFQDDRTAPAHLVMLGGGVAKESLVAMSESHPRIHFMDPVPRDLAAELLSLSDISVASLVDHPLFSVTMPSKIYSTLARATPLLVIARGDAARLVMDAKAGTVAAPGDLESIIAAVFRLVQATPIELAEMGKRGRAFYDQHLSRAIGAARISDLLRGAALRPRSRRQLRKAQPPAHRGETRPAR